MNSGWSLRVRLLISVGLVLLPPAILSVMQGIASARRDVEDLRGQMITTAKAAATPAENILASAREVAITFSILPGVRDGTADCSTELASALRGATFLTDIERLDPTGRVVCAGKIKAVGISFGNLPAWRTIASQNDFTVSGMSQSQLTHRSIVMGLLPLHGYGGRFQGAVEVSVDAHVLDAVLKKTTVPPGSVMAIFDRDRNIIATTNDPAAHALFAGAATQKNAASANAIHNVFGKSWTYATMPLLGPNVFVGFARPEMRMFGQSYASAAFDFILPFVMIFLTWMAIWIVTDRQLIRWIVYLRRISGAYRSGHYALRPSLEGAPSELKGLGDALAEMAASIEERDRSLRDAIAQKNLLIKEIHHRVKNNLQVVMSLLSLQARRLKDPAAQEALADTRTRINALALVHRILYEIDDQNTVDIKRLLEQLAEQTSEGFAAEHRHVNVIADIVSRDVPSEIAVTLSFFTVEAMTNAFKHAFPGNRSGTIRVTLEAVNDHALRLAVEDDGVGFDFGGDQSSIGARLMKTFGLQVGGTAVTRSNQGRGSIVEVVFPDPTRRNGESESPSHETERDEAAA